jgi:hypothetical protein
MEKDKGIEHHPPLLDFLHPLSPARDSGPPARVRETRRRKVKKSSFRYFPADLPFLTPAGTAAKRDTVCFVCPNFPGANPP